MLPSVYVHRTHLAILSIVGIVVFATCMMLPSFQYDLKGYGTLRCHYVWGAFGSFDI